MNRTTLVIATVVTGSVLLFPTFAFGKGAPGNGKGGSVTATSSTSPSGKPGSGGTVTGNSLTLVQVTPRDGGPAFGDVVTFSITTTSTQPYVRLDCYQGGVLVDTETNGFFPSYPWGQDYNLGPTMMWTGGAASCTAKLITATRKGYSTLASIAFSVSA